ncbi:sirohydrochlorin chelatase [Bacillus daqingensis]|uniref:Sirohydrochlorin chelatase n=1 Tax=Bacillus daqingensis TaxID=872396 RepID=A0ABV9NX24_9BACI
MQGVLYIGHGSRSPKTKEESIQFIQQVEARVEAPLQELCFLELESPTIRDGFTKLVENGATSIAIVPLLLLSAGHYYADIPEELEHVREEFPHIRVTYGRPLGVQQRTVEALARRAEEAGAITKNTVILLVGRGSRSPETKSAVRLTAKRLKRRLGVKKVETCYLAACKPSFAEGMESAAKYDDVIVLPYLWFTGLLYESMEREVAASPFRLAPYLGAHLLMVEALSERAGQALHAETIENRLDEHMAWWI